MVNIRVLQNVTLLAMNVNEELGRSRETSFFVNTFWFYVQWHADQ